MNERRQTLDFRDREVYDRLIELAESPVKRHVHKTNAFDFSRECDKLCVGSETVKARNIRDIEKGDTILFLMPISSRSEETGLPCKKLMFVASAAVAGRIVSEKPMVGYDFCDTRLAIERLEFFETPVSGEAFLTASQGRHSADRGVTISDIFKTEYKQIESHEFYSVYDKALKQTEIPGYLKVIFDSCQPEPSRKCSKKYRLKDMIGIVNSAIGIYSMIRNEDEKARITDLIDFISSVFDAAGIDKSAKELEEIYSKIGRHLDFEHIHTRDASRGIEVLDAFGNTSRFGYIKFERPAAGDNDEVCARRKTVENKPIKN